MANPKTPQSPAEQPDAVSAAQEREKRMKLMSGRVVYYDELDPSNPADAELIEKMEKIMDPISRAPDSFEAIIDYGNEPLKKLGKIGDDMIQVQGKLNKQLNVMGEAITKMEGGFKSNMAELREVAAIIAKAAGMGALKGAKGAGNVLTSIFNKREKKTEDDRRIEEMQENLAVMAKQVVDLTKDVEETGKGLDTVMAEARKLGGARMEATKEINIYIGATKEILRRYDEEYIPEAESVALETGDQTALQEVTQRREDFIDRIAILEGSRAQGIIAAQQLLQLITMMQDQKKKVEEIIHNGQHEWKAMLASAGIAGSTLKAAQTLKKADKLGDDMLENTLEMTEAAHQMTLESRGRGTVDPNKLIEASERMIALIEADNVARRDRIKELEAVAVNLHTMTDKLIEAGEVTSKQRLLEAAEAARQDAAEREQERAAKAAELEAEQQAQQAAAQGGEAVPPANDNADKAQAAPKKAAPRRPAGPKP